MRTSEVANKSPLARMVQRFRIHIRHWYGQVAVAVFAALLCFISMYGIYLHLSKRLPDSTKIYQKTGLYVKKNWARGPPTASLGTETVFCLATAFRKNQCGIDGSGKTVTARLATFPNLWGDVPVVIDAKSDALVLSDFDLTKVISLWKSQSLFDCYLFSGLTAFFAFLGIRSLSKKISKE
jgi:hypothetical protein